MIRQRSMQDSDGPGLGIASRYRALVLTHGSLEEKLAEETERPLPDAARVRLLKRRKLLVKDELASIERLLAATRVRVDSAAGPDEADAGSER